MELDLGRGARSARSGESRYERIRIPFSVHLSPFPEHLFAFSFPCLLLKFNVYEQCDEVRPACSNCIKHSISCDFQSGFSEESSPLHPPKLPKHVSDSQSPGSFRPEKKTKPVITNGLDPGELHMGDLELLHQFVTQTCYTTSNKADSHELWRITVPKEGINHDFLMRGILAVAALHLSHLYPDRAVEYQHIANSHQDRALGPFQAAMTDMTESNCHAFFALSSLIVVYNFASPRTPGSLAFTYDSEDSTNWLAMIRGVNSILMPSWPWVQNGPLRGLLQPGVFDTSDTRLPKPADLQLRQLAELCESAIGGDEAVEAYKAAVKALRKCFAKIFTRSSVECEIGTAFTWPVEVPDKFIELLHARRPEALVILAHYCVVLHHLDKYWWLEGWAVHVMDSIYSELTESWREWIQWPSTMIARNERCLTWRPLSPNMLPTQTPGSMSTMSSG
ncbi:MAG: hypothetical protein LQ341_001479 [Variospora aurantia]|nr:MAG: hypothetical protein LQ341_001479 [Variospora aurantia]